MRLERAIEDIVRISKVDSHVERGLRYPRDTQFLIAEICKLQEENAMMLANLTSTQARCSELLLELRALRASP